MLVIICLWNYRFISHGIAPCSIYYIISIFILENLRIEFDWIARKWCCWIWICFALYCFKVFSSQIFYVTIIINWPQGYCSWWSYGISYWPTLIIFNIFMCISRICKCYMSFEWWVGLIFWYILSTRSKKNPFMRWILSWKNISTSMCSLKTLSICNCCCVLTYYCICGGYIRIWKIRDIFNIRIPQTLCLAALCIHLGKSTISQPCC